MPSMFSCRDYRWHAQRRAALRAAYLAKGWVGSERKLDEVISRKLRG